MKKTLKHKQVLTLAASLALVSGPLIASNASGEAVGCLRQSDLAQRTDMGVFRDYYAETFYAIRVDDATAIFEGGACDWHRPIHGRFPPPFRRKA